MLCILWGSNLMDTKLFVCRQSIYSRNSFKPKNMPLRILSCSIHISSAYFEARTPEVIASVLGNNYWPWLFYISIYFSAWIFKEDWQIPSMHCQGQKTWNNSVLLSELKISMHIEVRPVYWKWCSHVTNNYSKE